MALTRPGDPIAATNAFGLTKRELFFLTALNGLLAGGIPYADYEAAVAEAKAIADASIAALND